MKISIHWYSNADDVGYKVVDTKITLGYCQFHRHSLVFRHLKKQGLVALLIVEAKYITAEACCAEIL